VKSGVSRENRGNSQDMIRNEQGPYLEQRDKKDCSEKQFS